MVTALVVCAAVLAVAAGSIYAGAFRAKNHVEPWESARELTAAAVLMALAVLFLVLGLVTS